MIIIGDAPLEDVDAFNCYVEGETWTLAFHARLCDKVRGKNGRRLGGAARIAEAAQFADQAVIAVRRRFRPKPKLHSMMADAQGADV